MNIQTAYHDSVDSEENKLELVKSTQLNSVDFKTIEKSILKSQRCQRNWDLSKQLSEEQLNLILTAATECPTKQNIPFYCVKVVQDRETIEAIYNETYGPNPDPSTGGKRNPQVLANTVLVFCEYDYRSDSGNRNPETAMSAEEAGEYEKLILDQDLHQAIGIASGYVNLVSSMIGLQTGCCKCMDSEKVREILGADSTETPRLIMGIGFGDKSKPRREHQVTGEMVGSFNKRVKVDIIQKN